LELREVNLEGYRAEHEGSSMTRRRTILILSTLVALALAALWLGQTSVEWSSSSLDSSVSASINSDNSVITLEFRGSAHQSPSDSCYRPYKAQEIGVQDGILSISVLSGVRTVVFPWQANGGLCTANAQLILIQLPLDSPYLGDSIVVNGETVLLKR
jgi:hypothetical protein